MLKYRLLFGTLMTVLFAGVVIFDGWLDGSLTASADDDKSVQGTILAVIIVALVIFATLELSKLAATIHRTPYGGNARLFTLVSIVASSLTATAWYWPQFIQIFVEHRVSGIQYLFFVFAFAFLALLLCQYLRYGVSGVLVNCGVSLFSIIYLGLLGGFVLAMRIEFGLWPLLMFIFVVKSSDIGAYTGGSLFGKHKFSPVISPGKTWEGMASAAITAVIVALAFAVVFGIMAWWLAVVFGCCFAFIGQMGDLVESMIKRDAQQKDSANKVPGFGGILDIIDSPLVAAPLAYIFFVLIN